jgi:hypothetical protein
MENKNKYPECNVTGVGKIHLHTADKGEKFKIIKMTPELLQLKTAVKAELKDIVTLKIQINNGMFLLNVNTVGKIIDRAELDSEFVYTIEFVGMLDNDKEQIEQLIRDRCDTGNRQYSIY